MRQKPGKGGRAGKAGQLQHMEGQHHRFLDGGLHSQSHTSCFTEGPTDAQVLFNELCQRRHFAGFSAPQEHSLKLMAVDNKDCGKMDLKYELFI